MQRFKTRREQYNLTAKTTALVAAAVFGSVAFVLRVEEALFYETRTAVPEFFAMAVALCGVLVYIRCSYTEAATAQRIDQAQRVHLEQQFHEAEKFKRAIEAATDSILITDAAGNTIYFNKAWQDSNGYMPTDILGKDPRILLRARTSRKVCLAMDIALTSGQGFESDECVVERKDGTTYWAHLSVYPVRELGTIVHYVYLGQDITERKQIEHAKSEFVSLASHQLRTPLATTNWYLELFEDAEADGATVSKTQKSYLHEIAVSNTRMIRLVDTLLNVSRIDLGTFAVEPEEVAVDAVLRAALQDLQALTTQKKVVVHTVCTDTPCVMEADPTLLNIILQNLLSNAIKYSYEGGEVVAEISQTDEALSITVTDHGYGIPRAAHERIFSKLFRAENIQAQDVEGNGLGLYLVHAIVRESGGTITFTSDEGQGSTFIVTYPRTGMLPREGTRRLDV